MRKVLLSISFALIATLSCVAQIACQAGKLSQLVSDTTITTLTVTGEMDARDFRFIAQKLNALTSVDLSSATIVAYEDLSHTTLGNKNTFAANEIPTLAFSGKQHLQQVMLPASITSLAEAAFAACPSLTSITLPQGLKNVGNYAFTACTSLTTITLPGSVTSIGKGAFARCTQLTQVNSDNQALAAQLTVGDEAFMNCTKLTTIALASNLTAVGEAAFAGTGLKVVDLSQYKQLKTIGNWAFTSNAITSATLSPALQELGQGVFLYDDNLENVTLPESIQTIGDFAFAGNEALSNIKINGGSTIGNYAFYNDAALQELVIPERVNFIGTQAMAGMTGLKTLTALPSTVPALGENVWAGVNQKDVTLLVSNNALQDYATALQWKEFNVKSKALRGDVNEDGVIDVDDVNMLIDIILKSSKDYPQQADVNEDGVIDVDDVNIVIDIILGFGQNTYVNSLPNTNDAVIMNDVDIAPGETRDIELKLTNEELCAHLQCDITLPQGVHMANVKTTGRTAAHTIVTNKQDNTTRIICYSAQQDDIQEHSGSVIVVTIIADEYLCNASTINVSNIILSHIGQEKRVLHDTSAQINNTSGVDNIMANTDKVYAAGGTLIIETQQATTAQLVSMNGASTTLHVEAGQNTTEPASGIYVVRLNGKSYKVAIR